MSGSNKFNLIQRYPLHIHITTLFLVLILLVGGTIAGVGFKLSRDMLEATATDLIDRIGRETGNELAALIEPAELAMNLVRHDALNGADSLATRAERLPFLKEALLGASALSSIYAGYANGDFFFLRQVHDEAERLAFKAPEGTRYILQAIEQGAGQPVGRYIFMNQALQPLRTDDRPDYAASYDPRKRGWYHDAISSASAIKTPPYLFFSNRKVGMTLAARGVQGDSVIGADILLETLASNLKQKN